MTHIEDTFLDEFLERLDDFLGDDWSSFPDVLKVQIFLEQRVFRTCP
jgi:hypothetical protein